MAYASRTDEAEWAAQCLRLLRLPGGMTLGEAAPLLEIQGGTKKRRAPMIPIELRRKRGHLQMRMWLIFNLNICELSLAWYATIREDIYAYMVHVAAT